MLLKQQIETLFSPSPWAQEKKKIHHYVELLLEYNERYNLFSRQLSVQQLLADHVYDSLLGEPYIPQGKKVVDIGSGGGFPGLCWALVRPDLRFCLVEKSFRKAEFLKEASALLGLQDRIIVEQKPVQDCDLDSYEIFVSRAMCSARKLLSLLGGVNLQGKTVLLFKARLEKIHEEIAELPSSVKTEIIQLTNVPSEKQRHLLSLCKNEKEF